MVIKRTNNHLAQYALMTNMAISAIPSMGVKPASTRKAQRDLDSAVKKLTGE